MEKCVKCKKDFDIMIENNPLCAFHYVENEGEDCLVYDIEYAVEGKTLGKNKESTKKILKEIRKKYPDLAKEK